MHNIKGRYKQDTAFVTMMFCFGMGLWVSLVLIVGDFPFLLLHELMPYMSQNSLEISLGMIGLASSLIGLMGVVIGKRVVKVISLAALVGFFSFIGTLLTYPRLATGSNFLLVALMCAYSSYRGATNE